MLKIPPLYEKYLSRAEGKIFLLGAVDTGKTTLARLFYIRMVKQKGKCAFIDMDPGQSKIGVPGFHWLQIYSHGSVSRHARLLGALSPRGHEHRSFENLKFFINALEKADIKDAVLDTCGYMREGGTEYKMRLIEIFKPDHIIFFLTEDSEGMLEKLLSSPWAEVTSVLQPQKFVKKRDPSKRALYRYRLWHFFAKKAKTHTLTLSLDNLRMLPPQDNLSAQKIAGKIAGLEDESGFQCPCWVERADFSTEEQLSLQIRAPELPPYVKGIEVASNLPLRVLIKDLQVSGVQL